MSNGTSVHGSSYASFPQKREPRATLSQPSASSYTFLIVPIVLLFGLLFVSVLRSPSLISSSGIGSAVIVATPLILATYALTLVVMAGRGGVDLSIGPLIGFINVTLVQLFAAGILTSPYDFFLYAIGVGIVYQLIFGLIIVYVRIQPIIVGLSGFLTLAGLNLIILPRPGGTAPEWMATWGLGETIWSPVLGLLILATIAWFLFTRTALFDHLRLMGSDERTAFSAGVNITVVRLAAHVAAGIAAGLAAITFTALISSGDPTQGSRYTLMAVTALVLGGTSLAGGRGSIVGSLLGAVNIYLITYLLATFNFGKIQSFVTELSYGGILVIALLLTIFLPQIQARTRGISPFLSFVVLGLIAVGVVLYSKDEARAPVGASLGQGMTSLTAEQSGQSLMSSQTGQSLSSSQSGQSLMSSQSTGTSLMSGTETEPKPTGTPVMIAAVIVAAVAFLIYLLYRYLSLPTVVLIAILAVLVLGYAAHEPGTAGASGAGASETGAAGAGEVPWVLFVEGLPSEAASPGGSLLQSLWVSGTLFLAAAILFGSALVFLTVPHTRTRLGNTSLLFIVAAGAVLAAIFHYGHEGLRTAENQLYFEALGAIVIGALLFIVTLPKFQANLRNPSLVMIALLAIAVLGATLFAAAPVETQVGAGGAAEATAAVEPTAAAQPLEPASLSPGFFHLVFWVLASGTAVFLVMLPGVRRHLLRNVSFEQSLKSFSYLGIFIFVFAVLALGGVFYVAGIPLWKFIVTIVAAIIGARFLWHFLRDLWGRRTDTIRGER